MRVTSLEWLLAIAAVPALAGILVWAFAPGAPSPTGCPACGSDDYDVLERTAGGEPDYDGPKECQECGEVWQ